MFRKKEEKVEEKKVEGKKVESEKSVRNTNTLTVREKVRQISMSSF